jgi:hypothetical protein
MLNKSVFEILKATDRTVRKNEVGKELTLQAGCLCYCHMMEVLLALTCFNITEF